MAFSSPLDAIIQARQNKDQTQMNQFNQFAQQLGGAFGNVMQGEQQGKKKQQWEQYVDTLVKDPSIPEQYKQFAPALKQAGPEQGVGLIQSLMKQTSQKQTSPWRVVSGMLSKGGKPVQQNELTGEVREANLDVQPTTGQRSSAIQSRTDYLNKALDYKQRDLLAKNTNLPAQQLKTLTQNNIRADRALDLLNKPAVTWQALSFALTDLGAIMQGGVPHKEQLLDAQFPSWKQKLAQYRTFATGQPTANVPEPIRNEVAGMIQSLKKVDNQFLEQNKNLQLKMLGPTVQGMDKLQPIIEQGTQQFMGSNVDMTKMSDDELRRIAGGK